MSELQVPFSYLEWIVATKKYVDDIELSQVKDLEILHHLMAASYAKMYSSLPGDEYFNFSKSVKFYQMWAAHDQEVFSLIKDTEISDPNDILTRSKNESYIFCTYHLGSYRLLNSILAANDVPYSLVTDHQYIEEQGARTKDLFQRIKQEFSQNPKETLDILDAESPSIGLQTIRKLKAGSSLLFYIDGNTGVNGHLENRDNFARIRFMDTPYYARKGIAFVSHFSKVPIVPVVSVRTGWLSRKVYFLDPIFPEGEREEFCLTATQQLYTILETYLKQYPEQWESWMYVYKSIDTEDPMPTETAAGVPEIAPGTQLVINSAKYELMEFGSQRILFEKKSFKIHSISGQFYEVLNHYKAPAMPGNLTFEEFSVTEEAILELYGQGILTVAKSSL